MNVNNNRAFEKMRASAWLPECDRFRGLTVLHFCCRKKASGMEVVGQLKASSQVDGGTTGAAHQAHVQRDPRRNGHHRSRQEVCCSIQTCQNNAALGHVIEGGLLPPACRPIRTAFGLSFSSRGCICSRQC